jgi:hypothetical protein
VNHLVGPPGEAHPGVEDRFAVGDRLPLVFKNARFDLRSQARKTYFLQKAIRCQPSGLTQDLGRALNVLTEGVERQSLPTLVQPGLHGKRSAQSARR